MAALRCRSCQRCFGVMLTERPVSACCSELCSLTPPVSRNQVRDDVIIALWHLGTHPADIAREVGISRPRIYQVLDKMSLSGRSIQ